MHFAFWVYFSRYCLVNVVLVLDYLVQSWKTCDVRQKLPRHTESIWPRQTKT